MPQKSGNYALGVQLGVDLAFEVAALNEVMRVENTACNLPQNEALLFDNCAAESRATAYFRYASRGNN